MLSVVHLFGMHFRNMFVIHQHFLVSVRYSRRLSLSHLHIAFTEFFSLEHFVNIRIIIIIIIIIIILLLLFIFIFIFSPIGLKIN